MNSTLSVKRIRQLRLTNVHSRSEVVIKCNTYVNIWFGDITHLEMSNLMMYGDVEITVIGARQKSRLTCSTTLTVLVTNVTIEGFKLLLDGNSNFYHCQLNKSIVHLLCMDIPTIRRSLSLYKSKSIDITILGSGLCKNVKLAIVGSITEKDLYYLYQGTIKFASIGPAANIQVEVTDIWFEGELVLLAQQQNNNICLYIHRSELKYSLLSIKLSYEVRNNNVRVQITDCRISDVSEHTDIQNIPEHTQHTGLLIKVPKNFLEMKDVERSLNTKTAINIAIENCTFINNSAAVTIIITVEPNVRLALEMLITDSIFNGNEHAIDIQRKLPQDMAPQITINRSLKSYISLRNVTLQTNSLHLIKSGAIRLVNIDMLHVQDCKFIANHGSAIESYFSGVTLAGDALFSNNTSIKGGALFLYESFLYLKYSSNVSFFNNNADDTGGAIYLKQRPYIQYDRPPCFVQLKSLTPWLRPEFKMNFNDNMASNGGDDIYGGSVHSWCEYSTRKMFHFHDKTLSSITSDPTRVCLCDDQGTPQCANMEYIFRELPPRYPGEVFTVPAVVVGYDFGTVPGIVYSELLGDDGYSSIMQNHGVHEIKNHRGCTRLSFSIETPLTDVIHTIQLNIGKSAEIQSEHWLSFYMNIYKKDKTISSGLLHQPVRINIPLENCPAGFTLTTTPPYICTCHPKLVDNGITVCIITNHTGWVYRSGTIWVSNSFGENETNSFVVHQYCPYDYCKPENISVDLDSPDTQCAFNHSGVLCGGCHGNLSLTLGTSRCLPCDNRYVSLLIVFVLAGLALVFFIKVLDLTVAKGTINGLIFYANIAWANKSILFPTTETLHPVQQLLHTFIAWLNLDLGIETCFIDGLDAYWKTWLQFVFPLYVWSITGIVIIASHYSTRVSKIFGNNSVPVLATLILLSYAKLLRTIITCLGFSLLNYPEGTRVVWSFDGNIAYFDAAHTIMFLVALLALLLLWLPYTTVLLTLQRLRRKSYLKPLRWINRWKPFFDAYLGLLKSKHHYWVGLLLLVRVVLLVLFAATSAIVPKLNIIAMAIVGLLLFIKQTYTGLMYKSLHLSMLENSFIVNITVLGMAKLYMLPSDSANTVLYTSIGIVFIEFLAIVIYHTWSRLKFAYLTHKRRHKEGENTPADRQLRVAVAVPPNHVHYREPLLDSSIQDK